MAKAKPTVEEIREIIAWVTQYYSAAHSEFLQDEKYFNLEFEADLGLPAEHRSDAVLLPTARDIVQTAKAHIDTTNPRVLVTQVGAGQAAEAEAEMRRKFYQGMLYRMRAESPISPWDTAVSNLCLYGLAVLKVLYDPDRWPDKPERHEGETDDDYEGRLKDWEGLKHDSLPIVVLAIHPTSIMVDPSYWHSAFVVEQHRKLVLDVSRKWPNWINLEGKGKLEYVDYTEYWDDEYRSTLIDGQPVLRQPVMRHRYGFMPYVFSFSGLGIETEENFPEYKAVGLLRYIRDTLAAESRAFSIYDIVLRGSAWPVKVAVGENANLLTEFKLRYGTIQPLPPGVELKDVISPPPTEALLGHLQYTNSVISQSAAPRSVRGFAEPGVRSGYDRAQIIEKAELGFGIIRQNAQKMTAQALSMCSKVLERLVPGNISVWAKTPMDDYDVEIKKDKIKGHLVSVEFKATRAEEEMRQAQNAQQLVAAGLISRDTARRKYLENIDADAEAGKLDAEKIRGSPPVMQVLAQAIAQELARTLGVRQQEQELAQGQRQPVSPVPQGIPGIPPQPATRGSPEEIAQILKAQVSPAPMPPEMAEMMPGIPQ